MAFITKYRPKSFTEVTGHEAEVKSIKGQLAQEEPPHAYLLTGPSGVGKTTIARIMAGEIGATASGIIEMNIADMRTIDDMRELVKQARIRIPGSKRTVYILDEVHQLTENGQNVILKVLEDTPAHAFFILCTTEPNKLLATIRTRCQEFRFQPLDDMEIANLIIEVADHEGIDIHENVITDIVERAFGSARLALSMLEKCREHASEPQKALRLIDKLMPDLEGIGAVSKAQAVIDLLQGNKKAGWQDVSKYLRNNVLFKREEVQAFKRSLIYAFNKRLLEAPSPWMVEAILLLERDLFGANTEGGLTARVYHLFNLARSNEVPTASTGRKRQPSETSRETGTGTKRNARTDLM